MKGTPRVAVVGGGLAGLVAARHLADGGVDVDCYEREAEFGGRVRSRQEDGFTIDRGFQVLFTSYPALRRELDLEALSLRSFSPGAVLARPGERSVLADPMRDPGALTDTLFNTEVTTRDKLRTLRLKRELADKSETAIFSGPDRSIRAYLERRGFSEGFVESFAEPFYGGITLDRSLSTSKRVFEYTFKCLSTGKTAVPAAGMGELGAQLAARAEDAGVDLHPETPVEAVDADEAGATLELDGETVEVDAVVVATDPPTARELTGVESIPTDALGCVTQYYRLRTRTELPVGKRLVLNAENDRPNTLAPLSTVAPEYAPDGEQLLSATFLGHTEKQVARLDDWSRRAIESWFPERSFNDLELLATERIPFAQFRQPPNSHDELPAPGAPDGRCFLAGDYTRWSSLNGALESGRDAAQTVLASL